MLKSKTIDRVCCLALVVMLAVTAVVWSCKAAAGKQKTIAVGYENLFDSSVVHTIDISVSDWDSFIATASSEEYAECTVTIDGEKISSVGIRAKGNTSLSSVSTLGSEKYSFKIEFDHYVKGRLYNGLDKLSLNNLIYDATMMKDYLAYTLMAKMDVPSPLCSFAQLTVNGEAWGLYLAVEGVEDSFMERNNMTAGELYKPDSMSFGGGRGNGGDFDFEQFRVTDSDDGSGTGSRAEASQDTAASSGGPSGFSFPGGMAPPDGASMPEGMTLPDVMSLPEGFSGMTPPGGSPFTPPSGSDSGDGGTFSMPNFSGKFNFGMGSGDTKLVYTDDDPDSYSNIFSNAKTKVGKKDKARLIEALKTLNSEDAQEAVFTDEVIRYLAVHNFLQNDDSYTGMMVHNYYLYEEGGKLAIIPWDYNLAFGGMGASGDASTTVNSPVDSPVSGGTVSDRPLVSWIFDSEEALSQYHEIYSQFVSEVIESGWLAEEISRVADLIRPYVEADANSFYSVDEFDRAVESIQSYCALRGESIRGQLDGTIPSTTDGQRADSSALVDTGGLNLSDMGVMNTGGGDNNGPGGNGMPGGSMPSMSGGGGFDFGSFAPPDSSETETGSFSPGSFSLFPAASTGSDTDAGTVSETGAAAESASQESTEKTAAPSEQPGGGSFTPPDGFAPSQDQPASSMPWSTFAVYAAVLLAAILLIARIPGRER